MSEKHRKIYQALVSGATDGLSGQPLYDFVVVQVPKTSSKKFVRAALLALTDPDLTDKTVLDAIYALAIKHRLDSLGIEAVDDEDEPLVTPEPPVMVEPAPLQKTSRKKPAADARAASLPA